MTNSPLCYLDNAATTFPKPKSVVKEVSKCLNTYCGNAGRGSGRLSLFAMQKIYECREELCAFLGAPSPENIAFVPSCTYGLNLIIKGLLRAGDHVLISDMEHNSVLRPIEKLARQGKITYDIFEALSKPKQSDEELILGIQKKIKQNTRLLICTHQSNICSYSLPISKIGELCKKNNVLFVLDVAQTIGHYNINMQKMCINYLSAPGHKGLYGPQGSAFIAINSHILPEGLIEGGNGINSLLSTMPDFSPELYEVGTLPLPSIVGLCEGVKEVKKRTPDAISEHETELFRYAREKLLNIKGVRVYLPEHVGSTFLFNIQDLSPELVCRALDDGFICVRGGFHCTALAHASLSTDDTGAVRASFGIFNSKRDIDRLASVCNKLALS